MKWVCHNGKIVPADSPLFGAGKRGFRYGDGVFETAKVVDGRLLLAPLHFNRLFTSLHLLQIRPGGQFTPEIIEAQILNLCRQNGCAALARVRLAVYREEKGDGGYVIEAAPLAADAQQWNKEGWNLVVSPLARKSCDALAYLNSANFLPYVLAAAYAAEKSADEALVLNVANNVADGSKTNLFLVKDQIIYTPALNQGCVSGVMRTFIIESLKKEGYVVHQTEVDEPLLLQADEVFCTNAIQGIRWVRSFDSREYRHSFTQAVYRQLFANNL